MSRSGRSTASRRTAPTRSSRPTIRRWPRRLRRNPAKQSGVDAEWVEPVEGSSGFRAGSRRVSVSPASTRCRRRLRYRHHTARAGCTCGSCWSVPGSLSTSAAAPSSPAATTIYPTAIVVPRERSPVQVGFCAPTVHSITAGDRSRPQVVDQCSPSSRCDDHESRAAVDLANHMVHSTYQSRSVQLRLRTCRTRPSTSPTPTCRCSSGLTSSPATTSRRAIVPSPAPARRDRGGSHAGASRKITVRVGTGAGQRQRFVGVLLVESDPLEHSEREETCRVYRSRSGEVRAAPRAFVGVGLDRRTRRPGHGLGASTSPATAAVGDVAPDGLPAGLRRPGLAPWAGATGPVHPGRGRGPSSRSSWTSTHLIAPAQAPAPSRSRSAESASVRSAGKTPD